MPDYDNPNVVDNDSSPTKRNIWVNGFSIYKSQWLINWILSFVIIAVICALLCLGLINYGGYTILSIVVIFVPILILPVVFSCFANNYMMYKNGSNLTMRSFFSLFGGYYTRRYRQTFHFWKSLLWGLLAYFIAYMVFYFIAILVCQSIDASLYSEMNSIINEYVYEGLPTEYLSLNDWLIETGTYNMYLIYSVIGTVPVILAFNMTFLYNISKHSVSVYYRVDHPQNNPATISEIFKITLRMNGAKYRGDLWSFIGPELGIFLVGFCVVFIPLVCINPSIDTYQLYMVYGLLAGYGLLFFFMPFFMPLTMAMNEKWSDGYQNATLQYNQQMYQRLNAQAMYTEAQRRAMEEEMRKNGQDPYNTVNNDDQNNQNNNNDNQNNGNGGYYGGDDSNPWA
ncbi:MAG: hypothetical protein LUD22_00560 [Coprobacillus sp.]|nr:hypothetical protein [Coprobacillus sp.]